MNFKYLNKKGQENAIKDELQYIINNQTFEILELYIDIDKIREELSKDIFNFNKKGERID